MARRETWVYIAGPYTHGDVAENVHNACLTWKALWDAGYVPICPHCPHMQHLIDPMTYARWLESHTFLLSVCHAVLRIPGPSDGADKEVEMATQIEIPVFFNMQSLVDTLPPNADEQSR